MERLLKLDPTNTVLLQQKQELLAKSVEETEKKLETLKTASEQAAASADKYDEWKAKYTPIQQEIEKTKEQLKALETEARKMESAGKVDTSQYAALQSEIRETDEKLKGLRDEAKKQMMSSGTRSAVRNMTPCREKSSKRSRVLRNLGVRPNRRMRP